MCLQPKPLEAIPSQWTLQGIKQIQHIKRQIDVHNDAVHIIHHYTNKLTVMCTGIPHKPCNIFLCWNGDKHTGKRTGSLLTGSQGLVSGSLLAQGGGSKTKAIVWWLFFRLPSKYAPGLLWFSGCINSYLVLFGDAVWVTASRDTSGLFPEPLNHNYIVFSALIPGKSERRRDKWGHTQRRTFLVCWNVFLCSIQFIPRKKGKDDIHRHPHVFILVTSWEFSVQCNVVG